MATARVQLISGNANGVFVVGEVPVTCNIGAFSNTNYNANGEVTRQIKAGTIVMPMRLPRRKNINTGVTDVQYLDGWMILTFPYSSTQQGMISIKDDPASVRGWIKGVLLKDGVAVDDLFKVTKNFTQPQVHEFIPPTSVVGVTYREA